jgi:hypothetical protein
VVMGVAVTETAATAVADTTNMPRQNNSSSYHTKPR